MAATTLSRLGWPLAAALAAATLLALAFHGERPEPGLASFEPGRGLLGAAGSDQARAVELRVGGRSLRLVKGEDGWTEAGVPQALKLLRDSAPERIIGAGEAAERPLADFGLDPPVLTATIELAGAPPFVVHFGAANPLGLARYARVEGAHEVALVPGYVVESWERIWEAR